ncbi:GNAT family N-acetyltransferase [Candidatus Bathyarchaeota archaeon]|nr:GNAT family N-acetyltransferase [Candidatus Bathyarchaeota archaeon]
MLEGKNVNLRVAEKEDLPLLSEWFNNPEFAGRYNPLDAQESKTDIEKRYEKLGSEKVWFLILKKDGSRIGYLGMGLVGPYWEIGYVLVSSERGKGYCTEAAQLAVDYLFMSKDIVRIQATTHIENIASQKVLGKAGFQREGRIRKGLFAWGNWADLYLYGILREEWKEPKILKVLEINHRVGY